MADTAEPSIPLVVSIDTRDGTLTKDSRMVNCFAEQQDTGWAAIKRPGTTIGATVPSGTPQSIALHNNGVYAIVSDTLYRIDLGGTPTGAAIPSVTTTGSQYQWLSNVQYAGGNFQSAFKSRYGGWAINGSVMTKCVDVNYPSQTCEGLGYLNGIGYVVDITGTQGLVVIRGSAYNDPLTWPPLDFLVAALPSGSGVYFCNYLNYLALFTEFGLQMYYDAGNATGIAISPVSNAAWLTGCGASGSVVRVVDDLYFLSRSKVAGLGVTVLRGLTLSKISTPAIERLFNRQAFTFAYAQSFLAGGHSFYQITGTLISGGAITLTYDITTQQWHQWTSYVSGAETGFVGILGISFGTSYYMLDRISGTCLLLDNTVTQDDIGTVRGTQPIYTRIVTKPYDWGTLKRKFMTAVYFIADTVSTTVALSYTDDDYQTFSTPRTIDFSTVKKFGLRFGSSRRRAWQLLHTAATTLKVYAMEVDVEKSTE